VREIEARNAALLIAWRAKWESCEEDCLDPWPPILRRLFDAGIAERRLAARQFLRALERQRQAALRAKTRWFKVPYGQGWI